MKNLDLIGVPFPIDHSEFAGDGRLRQRVLQIEGLVEIDHDLADVLSLVSATIALEGDPGLSLSLSGCLFGVLPSAVGQSAILQYVRCFNASEGRTRLNPSEVFSDPDLMKTHETCEAIRNDFIAHQSANANRQYLFVLPASGKRQLSLNPYGQTSRFMFQGVFDWAAFISVVRAARLHVANRIEGLCETVRRNLTPIQVGVINSMNVQDARKEHFVKNKDAILRPLGKRLRHR